MAMLALTYVGLWLLERQLRQGIHVATLTVSETMTVRITKGFCDVR